jgi:hypothetical protein
MSSFWQPATKTDGPARFVESPGDEDASNVVVALGELLRLGARHADDEHWVCAEHVSRQGERHVGWLADEGVAILDHVTPPDEARLASYVGAAVARPSWLALGQPPVVFGDLTVTPLGAGRLRVDLTRVAAGHICTMKGPMRAVEPRVFVDDGVGCDARAVVFGNGVHLWENGDCSGARISCTGGYGVQR